MPMALWTQQFGTRTRNTSTAAPWCRSSRATAPRLEFTAPLFDDRRSAVRLALRPSALRATQWGRSLEEPRSGPHPSSSPAALLRPPAAVASPSRQEASQETLSSLRSSPRKGDDDDDDDAFPWREEDKDDEQHAPDLDLLDQHLAELNACLDERKQQQEWAVAPSPVGDTLLPPPLPPSPKQPEDAPEPPSRYASANAEDVLWSEPFFDNERLNMPRSDGSPLQDASAVSSGGVGLVVPSGRQRSVQTAATAATTSAADSSSSSSSSGGSKKQWSSVHWKAAMNELLDRTNSGANSSSGRGGSSGGGLLTLSEEVQLVALAQDGLQLRRRRAELAKRLGRPPSPEELADAEAAAGGQPTSDPAALLRRMRTADTARALLVRRNLRLVALAANTTAAAWGSRVSAPDLFGPGIRGLLRAVETFDASKGNRFATYCMWWVRSFVSRAPYAVVSDVYVQERHYALMRAAMRAERELTVRLGRPPTRAELAAAVGVGEETLSAAYVATRVQGSLDAVAPPGMWAARGGGGGGGGGDGMATLGDLVPDVRQVQAEAHVADEQLRVLLTRALTAMPPLQAAAISQLSAEGVLGRRGSGRTSSSSNPRRKLWAAARAGIDALRSDADLMRELATVERLMLQMDAESRGDQGGDAVGPLADPLKKKVAAIRRRSERAKRAALLAEGGDVTA